LATSIFILPPFLIGKSVLRGSAPGGGLLFFLHTGNHLFLIFLALQDRYPAILFVICNATFCSLLPEYSAGCWIGTEIPPIGATKRFIAKFIEILSKHFQSIVMQ